MLPFDAPDIGQHLEQMTSRHDDGDAVLRPLGPGSSEPKWLDSCNTYSVSDTFGTELCLPEEYQHQQYSTTCEDTQSPAFEPVGHDGTSSASSRIESSSSRPTVNPSQASDRPDNGNFITDSPWANMWEEFLEPGLQIPMFSGHYAQNKGTKKPYNSQCPICEQSLKRRDYIKPHVKRKHPDQYSSLYPTSRIASQQSFRATTTRQPSSSGEASSADDPAYDIIPTNSLSLEQELRTLGQLQWEEAGPSGASMIRQKRSLSSISLDTTISDGSYRQSVPPLSFFGNEGGRTLAGGNDRARTLACPFQKRDPSKHQKCLYLTLHRIKDVKQHIFRCHTKPQFYCASCYEVFDTAEHRDKHSRLRECERLDTPDLPQFEGITEDQRKQLGEKSVRTMPIEEQWFQIWSIVFPGAAGERPKSVYLGNLLEEMVPVLRTTWEAQRSSIVARVGEVGSQQLSRAMDCAMDIFLASLESTEGETAEQRMGNT